MSIDRIDDLEAFVAIVERGSLTAAARHLRRTLQSVSRSLSALERNVGASLIRRTTRRVLPTDTGSAFYQRIKPALDTLREAALEAAQQSDEASGRLRIGASVLFGPAYIVPVIAAFMDRHPKIEVELLLSDRFVDLMESGLDLAVRIGTMPDSPLKTRRLGSLRLVVFGAPRYFAAHGRPEHPRDLMKHVCVIRTADRSPTSWPFQVHGKPVNIKVAGRFFTDDAAASHAAVASGLGVGNAPLWQIRPLVDEGAVELILADFETPAVPIQAVFPATNARLGAKTRLFTEFLAARLKCENL
ncbi:LysR family transcriptional regulator [Pendulispora albinea]|uniref:LysR family transcriptional regulator n=1 Tax=Pendulispora albinea TaxID=2741071 RepID=A0ABZ2M4H4_9BACT